MVQLSHLSYQHAQVELTAQGTYRLGLVTPPNTPQSGSQAAFSTGSSDKEASIRDLFGIKRDYLRSIKWFKEGSDIASLSDDDAVTIDDLIDDCFDTKDFHRLMKVAQDQPINIAHYIALHVISYHLDEQDISAVRKKLLSDILSRATRETLYGEHCIPNLVDINLNLLDESTSTPASRSRQVDQILSYASTRNSLYAVAHAIVQSEFKEKIVIKTPLCDRAPLQLLALLTTNHPLTLPEALQEKYHAWSTQEGSLTIPEIKTLYHEGKKDPSSDLYQEMRELLKVAAEIVCARLENATYLQTSTVVNKAQAYGIAINPQWAYQHCRVPFPLNFSFSQAFTEVLPLDYLVEEKILRKKSFLPKETQQEPAESPHRSSLRELMQTMDDKFCAGIAT